jgi:hypothetical protein
MNKIFLSNKFIKGDKLLIIIILAITLMSFGVKLINDRFNYIDQKILSVSLDGKIIEKINLTDVKAKYSFNLKGSLISTIEIEKNRARFINAKCPDLICEKTGWIENAGETAVCLPNKAIIKIIGKDGIVDAIAK